MARFRKTGKQDTSERPEPEGPEPAARPSHNLVDRILTYTESSPDRVLRFERDRAPQPASTGDGPER